MSYVIKNHYTHDAAKWQEEFDRAGKEIKDPLAYTDANMAEGKRFTTLIVLLVMAKKAKAMAS